MSTGHKKPTGRNQETGLTSTFATNVGLSLSPASFLDSAFSSLKPASWLARPNTAQTYSTLHTHPGLRWGGVHTHPGGKDGGFPLSSMSSSSSLSRGRPAASEGVKLGQALPQRGRGSLLPSHPFSLLISSCPSGCGPHRARGSPDCVALATRTSPPRTSGTAWSAGGQDGVQVSGPAHRGPRASGARPHARRPRPHLCLTGSSGLRRTVQSLPPARCSAQCTRNSRLLLTCPVRAASRPHGIGLGTSLEDTVIVC